MTASEVKRRLREAATTFWAWHANQPKVGPKAYGSNWPAVVREAAEAYGYNDLDVKAAVPSAYAISRMEEAMEWLNWLEKDDRWLLWTWANGGQIWRIGQRFGKSEAQIRYWRDRVCGLIAGMAEKAA